MRLSVLLLSLVAMSSVACQSKTKFSWKMDPHIMTLTSEPSGATITQIMPYGGTPIVIGQTPYTSSVGVLSQAKFNNLSLSATQNLMAQVGAARLEFSKAGYQTVVGNYSVTEDDDDTQHHVQLNPIEPPPPADATPASDPI